MNFGDLARPADGADKDAIVDTGDGHRAERVVSRRAFDAMCDAVARGLLGRGLAAGDRIAILALNRLEYLALLFGAPRAGIVPVPINVKLPAVAIAAICADAGARLAFAESAFTQSVPEPIPRVDLDHDWSGFIDPGPLESRAVAPDDVALQIYTSGTTSRPKGVLLGHGGQVWNALVLARSRQLDPTAAMLVAAPLYHKNALIASKIAAAGQARTILLPAFDACAYIRAIGRHRATSLSGVATMYHLILAERALIAATDVSSVKTISVGSAPATLTLLDQLSAAFPGAAVTSNYGLTEGGPVPFGAHPEGLARPRGSVGYPLPDVECRLVGGRTADEGVLHVRNPGVMLGYHGLPETTAERLKDGWLDTQDVMRRDGDGFYYFVGRADDMFKCGGESVYPGEVETLLERHPGVMQAAVVPAPDALKGAVPVAFVVPRPGSKPGEEEIRRFALAHAAAYLHPRRVILVERLPLNGVNKIDRARLTREAQGLAPVRSA